MTRYYRVSFITEEQLSSLNSFDIFKENEFSDGLVLNLLRQKFSSKKIKEQFLRFHDESVILKYPEKPIDKVMLDELLRYSSMQMVARFLCCFDFCLVMRNMIGIV